MLSRKIFNNSYMASELIHADSSDQLGFSDVLVGIFKDIYTRGGTRLDLGDT